MYTVYCIFSYNNLALIYRLFFFYFFRQKWHFALFPFAISHYFFRLSSKYNIVFNIFLRGCAYEAECIDPKTGNLYMGETLQVTTWQHTKYKKTQENTTHQNKTQNTTHQNKTQNTTQHIIELWIKLHHKFNYNYFLNINFIIIYLLWKYEGELMDIFRCCCLYWISGLKSYYIMLCNIKLCQIILY